MRAARPAVAHTRGMALLPNFFGKTANNVAKNQALFQAQGVCKGAEAPTFLRSKTDAYWFYGVAGFTAVMFAVEVPHIAFLIMGWNKHSPPV